MKNNVYLADLKAIASQVAVLDEHSYRVLDRKYSVPYQQSYTKWAQPLHQFGQNQGDETALKASLQQQLAQTLYSTFFCTGSVRHKTINGNSPMPESADHQRTIALLSAANTSVNGVDPLWTVYSIDNYGNAFVGKNGLTRQLTANQWTFANPTETSLKVGTVVNLLTVREDTTTQPVFYHVRGNELVSQQAELARVYFNTDFDGALLLVREITARFNRYRLPFMFKCLNHPVLFTRVDSAVLYLNKFDFRFALSLLKPILEMVRPHLKPEIPLFTYELEPGVSFAEDPANGQSFGMSRCLLIAEALISAREKPGSAGGDKVAEIRRLLTKNGLDIDRLYLNPNSSFCYHLLAHDDVKPAGTR